MCESTSPSDVDTLEFLSLSSRSIFDLSRRPRIPEPCSSRLQVHAQRPTGEEIQPWRENSFQIRPNRRFRISVAKDVAEMVVQAHISQDTKYKYEWSKQASLDISEEVKRILKQQNYDRYKYVVQTYIGQKEGQSLIVASRSLCSQDTDSFTHYTFHNSSLWCIVIVHALYYE